MGQRAKPTKRPPGLVARDLVAYPAYCSFCLSAQDKVASLVSGPGGIFICGECVAVCTDMIASRVPSFPSNPGIEALDSSRLLALLLPFEISVREKNGQLRRLVGSLRARKVSWAKIGKALGISRQSAWERFSKPGQAPQPSRPRHPPADDAEQPMREP